MKKVQTAVAKDPEYKLKIIGQGEPVLLLHSSLSSHKQWLPLVVLLSERYSLWLPDLQGYGRNSTVAFSQNPVWSLADEADALLATLTPEQKNTPLTLIGHSFGGALALHLARTGKLKVKALLLFEPVAFHLLAAETDAQAVALTAEVRLLSEQMPKLNAEAAAQLFVDYWQQADYFRHLPARMQQQMAGQVWKVPQDFSALINEPATTADYAALQMPVLLIVGSESRQSALRVSQLLATCWPQAQITMLPTGHMGPVTASDLVNQHIVAFLAGLPHKAEPGS